MTAEAKTMIKQQRWAAIIDLCRQNTSVSVTELVQLLRVSEATVRRDLQQMEDLNMVSRYHGGVRLNDGQSEEPPMLIKSETNVSSKNQVARLAASMIKDNQMIYIDAGSSRSFRFSFGVAITTTSSMSTTLRESLGKSSAHVVPVIRSARAIIIFFVFIRS